MVKVKVRVRVREGEEKNTTEEKGDTSKSGLRAEPDKGMS